VSFDPRMPSKTEALILDLLARQREMYGLELVRASGGLLKRGTIYVLLSRMEEKGFVASRQQFEATASGLPKRIYTLTGLGQRAIAAISIQKSTLMGLPEFQT
jgi:DNA-binding PadR family transcriptional regulator